MSLLTDEIEKREGISIKCCLSWAYPSEFLFVWLGQRVWTLSCLAVVHRDPNSAPFEYNIVMTSAFIANAYYASKSGIILVLFTMFYMFCLINVTINNKF